MLQNFYTSIQTSNYNLLYLSFWLRGKSELPLLNEKVKLGNSCVNIYIHLNNCRSKVFGSRRFLSKSFWSDCRTIVFTGNSKKQSKEIKYKSVECNSFLK